MTEKLTPQEMFDRVWDTFVEQGKPLSYTTYLVEQGKPSFYTNYFKDFRQVAVRCRYRAGDNKCAAGLFVPDENYVVAMEKTTVGDIKHSGRVESFFPEVAPENIDLLIDLQKTHDWVAVQHKKEDHATWIKYALRELAKKHGLTDRGAA